MHLKNRSSDLTGKDKSSVLGIPPAMTVLDPKKGLIPILLISLALMLVIGSIVGFIIYQSYQDNVNRQKAHDAYLSSLSGNGTLIFSDPLREASSWWRNDTDGGATTCQFEGNAYHIKPQGSYFKGCYAQGTYSKFAFEVQLTIIQGDSGGITFRDSHDRNGMFYLFSIYQDGKYDIARYAMFGTFEHLLPYGHSSAIHTGLGKPNTMAVRASGRALTFYVNEQEIQHFQDDGYDSGSIGLTAYPENVGNEADLSFTNARLWTL
jgi:hypothetical protein